MKIKEILSYLDNIPCVNAGGCGIAALSVYLCLKEHGYDVSTMKFKYLYHSEEDDCYEHNSRASNYMQSAVHIAIEWKGLIFDSGGILDRTYRVQQTFGVNELLSSIVYGYWNPCFNRNFIGDIENILNINISQYLDRVTQPINTFI